MNLLANFSKAILPAGMAKVSVSTLCAWSNSAKASTSESAGRSGKEYFFARYLQIARLS